MDGNFAALWPTDLILPECKDLKPFSVFIKSQEASSILRIDFVLLKKPRLHRAYLLAMWFDLLLDVCAISRPPMLYEQSTETKRHEYKTAKQRLCMSLAKAEQKRS